MTKAAKKYLSYSLKALIFILAFAFIYHQYLEKDDNLKQFKASVSHIDKTKVIVIMTAVVILMFLNWLVEALKWQHLTQKLVNISLWESVEGVFSGLTWAIFTPNRLGEFGGRVMFLPPRRRIHGIFAMAVGSFSQNVITNVLGTTALTWFAYRFMGFQTWVLIGFTLSTSIFIALFLVLYFHVKWLVWLLNKITFLKKYHRFFDIMGKYKFNELLGIMWFSLTRFSIFSFQYYLVIHLLIPQIPLYEVLLLTFIVFFIQSALPSLDLFDIAVRSTVAAKVFGYVTHQQVAIIAAFASIWLINLMIPAILGSVFIFKLNFFDRN